MTWLFRVSLAQLATSRQIPLFSLSSPLSLSAFLIFFSSPSLINKSTWAAQEPSPSHTLERNPTVLLPASQPTASPQLSFLAVPPCPDVPREPQSSSNVSAALGEKAGSHPPSTWRCPWQRCQHKGRSMPRVHAVLTRSHCCRSHCGVWD